jgi:hypothetical protein
MVLKIIFPGCIRRHQILSNPSKVTTKSTQPFYLHASVLIKDIIECVLNESVCRTLSILFNKNYLKFKFLKFLKISLQFRNQRKINLLFTLLSLSLITSILLFTLLPLCHLSLPIYYLRYYHSVTYHVQFIIYAIITVTTSNLLFTLLSLCHLSRLIYYLLYYHSVTYHFQFIIYVIITVTYHFQFIIYAITTLSLIASNLLFTLLSFCHLSLPFYCLRFYHSVTYHFQFIIYAITTFSLITPNLLFTNHLSQAV